MKRLFYSLALACSIHSTASAGLDDSGEKKITVRTEISRGREAVMNIYLSGGGGSLLDTLREIDAPAKENKQAGKDSPGFILGARECQWSIEKGIVDSPNRSAWGVEYLDLCRQDAEKHFQEFRALQKELDLDDSALAPVLIPKNPARFVEEIQAWEARRNEGSKVPPAASRVSKLEISPSELPRLIKESQSRALRDHPDLAVSGSAINTKFVAAYRKLQSENSLRLQESTWPEKLADECAAGSTMATR